jgi:hypothetical protein
LLCIALLGAANTVLAAESSTSSADAQSFGPIGKVLLHPRCLNCHTGVDYPKQGDDRHPHWFRVVRGGDDRGAPGMRCATCHQPMNDEASGVPGAPNWHTAPRSMAWEQKTPAQLCRTLLDRNKNGDRSIGALVDHMSNDPLVAWGWAPGGRRGPVPIAKQDFVALLQRWQKAGAPCPK